MIPDEVQIFKRALSKLAQGRQERGGGGRGGGGGGGLCNAGPPMSQLEFRSCLLCEKKTNWHTDLKAEYLRGAPINTQGGNGGLGSEMEMSGMLLDRPAHIKSSCCRVL